MLPVCGLLNCSYTTLSTWIDKYLEVRFPGLVASIKHDNVPQKLSQEQKQELKKIVLDKSPQDFGINRNLWTGKVEYLFSPRGLEVAVVTVERFIERVSRLDEQNATAIAFPNAIAVGYRLKLELRGLS